MMFHSTTRELRRHPGRLVPALIAIALSVAFLVAAFVTSAAEQFAAAGQATAGLARADLVVSVRPSASGASASAGTAAPTSTTVQTQIATVQGIAVVNRNLTSPNVLTSSGQSHQVQLVSLPPAQLQPKLVTGQWPRTGAEIALGQSLASALGADVGQTISLQYWLNNGGKPMAFRVSGITDDAGTVFSGVGYVSVSWFAVNSPATSPTGDYGLVLSPGADASKMPAALQAAIKAPGYTVTVYTPQQATANAVASGVGGLGMWGTTLWACGVVAFIVGIGMIGLALSASASRRRQEIGVVRAAGASRKQVRHMLASEAWWLGIVGSLIGVVVGVLLAVAATGATGALGGMSAVAFPWLSVAGAFVAGVVATLIVARVAARKVVVLTPAEALAAYPPDAPPRKSVGRAVVCWLLLVVGAALVAASLVVHISGRLILAATGAGCLLVGLAVLIGAALYTPGFVRVFGAPVKGSGASGRLAVTSLLHAGRRRSGALTALILVVGVTVGIQVASAAGAQVLTGQANQASVVDLAVASTATSKNLPVAISNQTLYGLASIPGISSSVTLSGLRATDGSGTSWLVLRFDSDVAKRARNAPGALSATTALAPPGAFADSASVTLKGSAGTAKVTVTASSLAAPGELLVSPQVLSSLGTPVGNVAMWMSLSDPSMSPQVVTQASGVVAGQSGVSLSGAATKWGPLQDVLSVLTGLGVMLLVAAFLVALFGLGTALGRSVGNHAPELALVRSLGMRRGKVRGMVRSQAVLRAVVGLVVGAVVGGALGWLAADALSRALGGASPIAFGIAWPQTVALAVVVIVGGLLAGVVGAHRVAAVTASALASR